MATGAHMGLLALLASVAVAQPGEPEPSDLYRAQPQGALSGATIFLSPGHGWHKPADSQNWTTQRGVTHGLIEDHSNGEAVLQYLVPYLWNAGANVVTARERDLQPNMVIVEAKPGASGYEESGAWSAETSPAAHGGSHRVAQAIARGAKNQPVATATFTPDIPEEGYYAVYAWYSAAKAGKTTAGAEYVIQHTGGTTIWKQDQNRDGETWKYMGTYWFAKGANAEQGSVTLSNLTAEGGGGVVADAVRFGGGTGESGHPRWEESGRYHAEFMGFAGSGWTRAFNTVSAMPMYAEWEAEPHERGRAIYIGWHTNAFNGNSRGLFSFIYGPNEWGGPEQFTGIPGGEVLGRIVHEEIAAKVHAGYDPEWRIGLLVCRWLGETNPRNNGKMPAALFEMGFHDNAEDAAYILDPRFRRLVARAVYHGIVKHYAANMDGFDNATMAPEPPTHLRAMAPGSRIVLEWDAPPSVRDDATLGSPATAYRVYRSRNGKGFDNGMASTATRVELDAAPGETVYLRVTATNAGGESLPGETLAVRTGGKGPQVLIVNGFDRLDSGLNIVQPDGAQRGILAKMNTFDYAIQHAGALEASGHGFSSASNEAVADGRVALADYGIVVWILGQESKETATIDLREREAVRAFLAKGGALFVSGSDIGFDLAESDGRFLGEALGCGFVETDSGVRAAVAAPGGAFEGMDALAFGSLERAAYPVKEADVLAPAGAARAALLYAGTERVAAVQVESPARVITFGFPFETIEDAAQRAELMARAMRFLAARETQVAGRAK